jgi:hypothetical protein
VKSDATHPCCTKDQAPETNVNGGSRTLGDETSLDKAERARLARVTKSWNILRSMSLRACTAFISFLGPGVPPSQRHGNHGPGNLSLSRFRALPTGFRTSQPALPCNSKRGPTSFLRGRGADGRCVFTDATSSRCTRRSGPFMSLELRRCRSCGAARAGNLVSPSYVMGRLMDSHKELTQKKRGKDKAPQRCRGCAEMTSRMWVARTHCG